MGVCSVFVWHDDVAAHRQQLPLLPLHIKALLDRYCLWFPANRLSRDCRCERRRRRLQDQRSEKLPLLLLLLRKRRKHSCVDLTLEPSDVNLLCSGHKLMISSQLFVIKTQHVTSIETAPGHVIILFSCSRKSRRDARSKEEAAAARSACELCYIIAFGDNAAKQKN